MLEDDYENMVSRLKKPGAEIEHILSDHSADVLHMTLGIAGEAGELVDAIKKWAIYGKPLDRTNVIEELGDLEFYMEGLRQAFGIEREFTLISNMHKLGVRYADGYSDDAAIRRADKEEV